MRLLIKNKDHLAILLSMIILLTLSYNFISDCLEINFIQDDAYTSFRYAKNFAEGKGLVFNEGEKVEGYTNFLWVLVLGIFHKMNIDLETAAQVMSLLFGVTAIWLTFFLSRLFIDYGESKIFYPLMCLLPPSLVSYSAPMMYWSVSGMETSLFISLTLMTIFLLWNRKKKTSFGSLFVAVSFLNSLVRPEGMLIFILLCLFDYIAIRNGRYPGINYNSNKYLNRERAIELAVYILLIFSHIAFRLIYYGHLLPNTFYAKTDFTTEFLIRGLNYFLEFAQNNLLYGALLVLPAFAYRSAKHQIIFFYYFILTNFIAIIFIGGDVLPIYRFFLPFLPIVFIFAIKGILSLKKLVNNKLKIAFAIITFSIIVIYGYTNYRQQLAFIIEKKSYEAGLVKKMKIYADWIESSSMNHNRITVALSTIGSFSYNTDARIIDIVGLANEYIAHNPKEVKGIDEELPVLWKERRYNADYVLQQKPDYIIFPAGAKPTAFAECALFVQEKFYLNYYTQLIYPSELNQLLPVFTKRNEPLQTKHNCDVKFVKHYIKASTIVNKITPMNKSSLLEKLINICDSAKTYCSSRLSDIDAVEGIGFFNVGDYDKSAKLFDSAVKIDSLNMIAHFYSMKIAEKQNRASEVIGHFKMLQKYSPSVFGSYLLK
ncbi:MAG: hypothetical protein AB1521_10195 [Bacteroidota bacterium]